ncbi:MAG: tRNA (guanosine(37)-N1)-methyltransferase TrmD [Clostridia bacterium]|nr:tRNA (guanosine(37)-N1)-methyltransferase TrmD [Clostridia bacterium]
MTKFVVLTLFPEMFEPFINTSIIKKAIQSDIVSVDLVNIRDYSTFTGKKVDDTPYGGGSGMVLMCEPLDLAIKDVLSKFEDNNNIKIIFLSPRGKLLNYNIAKTLSNNSYDYIFICGHYEGIDERIIQKYGIEEISIGDYVLTGGELPAMVLMDSIIRLKPEVLSEGSLDEESHTNSLLEYPQYTKPSTYEGMQVPEILLSGNHKKISEYRKNESIWVTYKNRPDILEKLVSQNLINDLEINKIIEEKGGK